MGNEDTGFTSEENAQHIRALYREVKELRKEIEDLKVDNNNIFVWLKEIAMSLNITGV